MSDNTPGPPAVVADPDPWTTLNGFFAERASWLRIDLATAPNGGWDVVLRLDGTYADLDMAVEVRDYLRRRLGERLAAEMPDRHLDDWCPPADQAP